VKGPPVPLASKSFALISVALGAGSDDRSCRFGVYEGKAEDYEIHIPSCPGMENREPIAAFVGAIPWSDPRA